MATLIHETNKLPLFCGTGRCRGKDALGKEAQIQGDVNGEHNQEKKVLLLQLFLGHDKGFGILNV